MTDDTRWPEGFAGIGGKTFKWTRDNREEWCRFTVERMRDVSGLFKLWRSYLLNQRDATKNKIKLRSTDDKDRSAD